MHKYTMISLYALTGVLVLYLLAFEMPQKPVDHAAEYDGQYVEIVASNDFVFGEEEYRVKAGEKTKLVLKNKSGIHGVKINGLDVELSPDEPEVELTFDKPGTYELVCSIMCGAGHANMHSKFIVE